jgi:hypothetical protein
VGVQRRNRKSDGGSNASLRCEDSDLSLRRTGGRRLADGYRGAWGTFFVGSGQGNADAGTEVRDGSKSPNSGLHGAQPMDILSSDKSPLRAESAPYGVLAVESYG